MSKIGKRPILIPEGVMVTVEGKTVRFAGPKGELTIALPSALEAKIADGNVLVQRKDDTKPVKSLHGTFARLILDSIRGVSSGWTKTLELVGTGFRGRLEGSNLVLSVGFSHTVEFPQPVGITFEINENKIRVLGADRHIVGQTAANIRKIRPPEPYKGKGIKYEDEIIRKKAGKAKVATAGA